MGGVGAARSWIARAFSFLAIVTIGSLVCMAVILNNNQTINSMKYGKSYVQYVYVNRNCNSKQRTPYCRNSTQSDDVLRNSGGNVFNSDLDPFVRNHNDTTFLWRENNKFALSIYILSVIGLNHTNISHPYTREIKLNGWEALKHRNVKIKCCVLWGNGGFGVYYDPPKTYYKLSSRLSATQYTCPIRGPLSDVKGVAMQFKNGKCSSDLTYVKPLIAKKHQRHSFAICLKIVYGEIDVTNLVHWLEYYKELKVDRVFMFTYNISSKVDEVIIHYINEGFVQRRIFNFPWKGPAGLKRDVGIKNKNAWQDEQVVVFDCVQRLSGYTYFAILDLDEYLLPKKYTNFKAFMHHLTFTYPLSAGFTFKSQLFVKDWGVSGAQRGPDVEKYVKRTPAILTRQKNIMITSRVIDSSVNTHYFTPKEGYKVIIVPEEIGAINHYRSCYYNLMSKCNNTDLRFTDTRILSIVKRYRSRARWIE